jgi:hypothetical protein
MNQDRLAMRSEILGPGSSTVGADAGGLPCLPGAALNLNLRFWYACPGIITISFISDAKYIQGPTKTQQHHLCSISD